LKNSSSTSIEKAHARLSWIFLSLGVTIEIAPDSAPTLTQDKP
jgi:hypothetical protein